MSFSAFALPSPADTLPSPSDCTPLPRLHISISPSASSYTSPSHSPSSTRSTSPSPALPCPSSLGTIPRLSIPTPHSAFSSHRYIAPPAPPSPLNAAGPFTPPCSPIEAANPAHLSFPLIASLLYTFPTGATLHPRTPSRNATAGRVGTVLSAGRT